MNKITLTADGSNTLFNEKIGEHYHSKHGAVQESKHVFVGAGFKHVIDTMTPSANQISVLEVGFGTGLNFLLTASYSSFLEQHITLNYTAIEAFPLTIEELESTGYENYVPKKLWNDMLNNYGKALQQSAKITPGINLRIAHSYLHRYESPQLFDLLYYDAFSVQHQPEMWTDDIIAHASSFLKPGGVFVTYAITGKLKRALKAVGFTIEKLPGAPGKREMLRATKQA